MASLQSNYEEQIKEARTQWEADRRQLVREVQEAQFELEQERKQLSFLKETVKRYEGGALQASVNEEAERTWRKEKDRLDQRLRQMARDAAETGERADKLAGDLAVAQDELKGLRLKVLDHDEAMASADRKRVLLEQRMEAILDQSRQEVATRQALERERSTLQAESKELWNRSNDLEDQLASAEEKLHLQDNLQRLLRLELDEERAALAKLQQEKAEIESSLKDTQLKLIDAEAALASANLSSTTASPIKMDRSLARRASSAGFAQLLAQIESDAQDRQALTKDLRKQERLTRELQLQLADHDRERLLFDEEQEKLELKQRKLQTRLEAIETRCSELEAAKRRCERDLLEERAKNERLQLDQNRINANKN